MIKEMRGLIGDELLWLAIKLIPSSPSQLKLLQAISTYYNESIQEYLRARS